eukprot:6204771-Pleurochrysis_carterae.AAC.1
MNPVYFVLTYPYVLHVMNVDFRCQQRHINPQNNLGNFTAWSVFAEESEELSRRQQQRSRAYGMTIIIFVNYEILSMCWRQTTRSQL